jgi:alpha-L-fucosidase 2
MKAIVAALAIGQTGVAARKFWTSKPADPGNVLMTGYTIGNGRQGGKRSDIVNGDCN